MTDNNYVPSPHDKSTYFKVYGRNYWTDKGKR